MRNYNNFVKYYNTARRLYHYGKIGYNAYKQYSNGPGGASFVTPTKSGPLRRLSVKDVKMVDASSKSGKRGRTFTATAAANANAVKRMRESVNRSRGGPAKSAGFFKTKRLRKRKFKIARNGVSRTEEYGGSATCPEVVTIGHITYPAITCRRMAWAAVLKHLMFKMQINMTDPKVAIDDLQSGDLISVRYQPNELADYVSDDMALDGTKTFESILDWLTNPSRPWEDQTTSTQDQFRIVHIRFQPATNVGGGDTIPIPAAMIRLDNFKVTITSKSSLKLKNQTVGSLGNEADEVDNQPLYGHSYEGNGTGAEWIREEDPTGTHEIPNPMPGGDPIEVDNPPISFIARIDVGMILHGGSNLLVEPPKPVEFKHLTRYGKAKLEPGEIKTSVLYSKETHYFNTWYNELKTDGSGTVYQDKSKFGKFRFFCVEKMLDPDGSVAIVMKFEHNIAYESIGYESKVNTQVESIGNKRNILFDQYNIVVPA